MKTLLIRRFIKTYNVNMDEATAEADSYPSFNAFFTRALKAGARPVADTAKFVLSPADGAISQLGRIESGRIFQAKGQDYTVRELLAGDSALAEKYDDGMFITVYLSPRDYHRVHMPVNGTLQYTTYVPGDLFSVNQTTVAGVPRLFARNERLVCVFDTELGQLASVMVGAMIVAGIATVWAGPETAHGKEIQTRHYPAPAVQPPPTLDAGAEMGRFMLGSTVILLFAAGQIEWLPELQAGSAVRMGQAIARKL